MDNDLKINEEDKENPEILIQKMKEVDSAIKEKMQKLLEKGNFSLKDFKNFFSNPSNFKKEEWEKIEKYKDDFLKSIWKSMGDTFKENYQKQNLKKEAKSKKHKSLGNRKNWIQMH